MAKARRPSAAKKRTSPKANSSKAARKAAAKKAPKKKVKLAAKPVQKVVELKKIREQFGAVLSVLSTRRSADPSVTTQLDSARARCACSSCRVQPPRRTNHRAVLRRRANRGAG